MTKYSRWIFLMPFSCVLAAFIAAFTLRFSVQIPAQLDRNTTPTSITTANREHLLDPNTSYSFLPNSTVFMSETGLIEISLLQNQSAYITINGPAEWTYRAGERHGTLIDHLLGRNPDYKLIFEQRSGSIRYDFSSADPKFEDFEIILRLPNGSHIPETPCFDVTITDQTTITACTN